MMHNSGAPLGEFNMGKHTRTTISVPAALKARMDAVDETVNWSAVACQAFESKLAEIITRKGARDMEEVIQRLRASKRESDDVRYQEALEVGRDWAENQAEAVELQRLTHFREENPGGGEEFESSTARMSYSLEHIVAFAIGGPEVDGSLACAQEFWESAVGEDESLDSAFLRGFVDGAVAIWYQVRDRL
jgi:hypothetical protein